MKRPVIGAIVCAVALSLGVVAGCSSSGASSSASAAASGQESSSAVVVQSASAESDSTGSTASSIAPALDNGVYTAKVKTDSTMFHVNETKNGTGELTVTDEGMSVHLVLNSKKITKLYAGTVEQAMDDPEGIIEPTTDTVTYSDGIEEEVYGFDVPVPALDEEFAVAILGSKGNWYDHKVIVSDPVSVEK